MAVEPIADLGMFVSCVIVEEDVDRLVAGDAGVDGIPEADELLVPVLLHVAPNHGAIEDVKRGEVVLDVDLAPKGVPFARRLTPEPAIHLRSALGIFMANCGRPYG